jgi:hypothetical protein
MTTERRTLAWKAISVHVASLNRAGQQKAINTWLPSAEHSHGKLYKYDSFENTAKVAICTYICTDMVSFRTQGWKATQISLL